MSEFLLNPSWTSLGVIRERAPGRTIYYAFKTCWWTDNPQHLRRLPSGVPCDPRGSVLLQAPATDFLSAADANPDHYGKHGLRTLEAAYEGNVLVRVADGRLVPTSLERWSEYEALLDA